MKKNVLLLVLFCILTIGCIGTVILGEYFDIPGIASISGIFLGFVLLGDYNLVNTIFIDKTDWKISERYLRKTKKINKESLIRVSLAYLYRIELDGKYVLIKNSRKTGKFQPVGGVYKYTETEINYLKTNFMIEPDDKINNDVISSKDYRFYLKDKDLRKFYKHFEKQKELRENEHDLSREFVEEILTEYNIGCKQFGSLAYSFVARFINFGYTSVYQCYELVLADILDVHLDEKQKTTIREICKNNKKDFLLASTNDILSQGVNLSKGENQTIISNHSWKILPSKIEEATYQYKNSKVVVNLNNK